MNVQDYSVVNRYFDTSSKKWTYELVNESGEVTIQAVDESQIDLMDGGFRTSQPRVNDERIDAINTRSVVLDQQLQSSTLGRGDIFVSMIEADNQNSQTGPSRGNPKHLVTVDEHLPYIDSPASSKSPAMVIVGILEELQDRLVADEEVVRCFMRADKDHLILGLVDNLGNRLEDYARRLEVESKSALEQSTSLLIKKEAFVTAKWCVSMLEATIKPSNPPPHLSRWKSSKLDFQSLGVERHCSIEEAERVKRFAFEGQSYKDLRHGLIDLDAAHTLANRFGFPVPNEDISGSRRSGVVQVMAARISHSSSWQRIRRILRTRVASGFHRVEWTCVSRPNSPCVQKFGPE